MLHLRCAVAAGHTCAHGCLSPPSVTSQHRVIEIWGDRIMLGTDYPLDMAEPDPVGFLARVKGVNRGGMALVPGGNAERLLGLKAAV